MTVNESCLHLSVKEICVHLLKNSRTIERASSFTASCLVLNLVAVMMTAAKEDVRHQWVCCETKQQHWFIQTFIHTNVRLTDTSSFNWLDPSSLSELLRHTDVKPWTQIKYLYIFYAPSVFLSGICSFIFQIRSCQRSQNPSSSSRLFFICQCYFRHCLRLVTASLSLWVGFCCCTQRLM